MNRKSRAGSKRENRQFNSATTLDPQPSCKCLGPHATTMDERSFHWKVCQTLWSLQKLLPDWQRNSLRLRACAYF